jgi:hypothetical protein
MALALGTESVVVTSQERTWRINIETPLGGDPVVTIYRETVRTAVDGTLISRETAAGVSRSLSDVAAQSLSVAGNKYTTAEIAGVIAAIADTWRQEDIDAAAAAVRPGA